MSVDAQIDVMATTEDPPKPTQFLVLVDQRHTYFLTYHQVKAAMEKFERMDRGRNLKPYEMFCGRCHADMSKQLGCAGSRSDCTGMEIFMRMHATECPGCAAGESLTMGVHRTGQGEPTGDCSARIGHYMGAVR